MGPIFLPGSPAPAGAKDFRMGLFDTIQIGPAFGGPGGIMSPPPGSPPFGTPPSVPPGNVFAPIQGGGGQAAGGPGAGSAVAAMGTILTRAPALRGDVTRTGAMAGSGAMLGTGLPEFGVRLGSAIPSGSTSSLLVLGDVTRAVTDVNGAGVVTSERTRAGTSAGGDTGVAGVRGDVTRVAELLRDGASRRHPGRTIAQDPGGAEGESESEVQLRNRRPPFPEGTNVESKRGATHPIDPTRVTTRLTTVDSQQVNGKDCIILEEWFEDSVNQTFTVTRGPTYQDMSYEDRKWLEITFYGELCIVTKYIIRTSMHCDDKWTVLGTSNYAYVDCIVGRHTWTHIATREDFEELRDSDLVRALNESVADFNKTNDADNRVDKPQKERNYIVVDNGTTGFGSFGSRKAKGAK